MGNNLIKKIFAKKLNQEVKVGEIVYLEPDLVMTHDHQGPMTIKEFENIGADNLWNPDKVVLVMDHRTPSQTLVAVENHQKLRKFAGKYGVTKFFDVGEGVCHDLVAEKALVRPEMVYIATDSHTVTEGALGLFATGVGSSEMASIFATGKVWLKIPETIKVTLKGTLQKGVYGKDIALKLLEMIKTGGADYKVLEFGGPGIKSVSVASRMSLCNMCLEMGAKTAIFPVDPVTVDYFNEKGIAVQELYPDEDAEYISETIIDLDRLEPLIAFPFSPDNVRPVSQLGNEAFHLNQSVIGTCTGARYEDLKVAAEILAGRQVSPGTRMLIVPATKEIMLRCTQEGIVETFLKAGAMVNVPCCGPCGAYGMGAVAEDESTVTTGSRNFVARMGAPGAHIYLSNAATAAASAIEGKLTDPRKYL
ncbi:MAG: 3-isopropylmalate dehydratase large subunit [Peptococcaceae bacterium]